MPTPQSPARVEQAALAALNAHNQQTLNYVQTCPVGSSPQIMIAWLNRLDVYVWYYQQIAPVANWLERQGLPQTAQLLNSTLRDLNNARSIYAQMYQNMLQTQVAIAQIWNAANNFAAANILAATRYSNAVFERWQQGMFDVMEERCYDCHRFINIPGGGYCYDCAVRRGLVY